MNNFLFFIYDLLFIFGLFLYMPIYFWRKKTTWPVLLEKLGFKYSLSGKSSVWIHVVSVGEANLIGKLIEQLYANTKHQIVISTTTLTGYKVASEKYQNQAKIIYFPYDLTFSVNQAIKNINPKAFICVETEIWPNLYRCLNKKNIPIGIINGRISDKALIRYKQMHFMFCWALKMCSFIAVQNEIYKEKFMQLGCKEESITVTGNMKFTAISPDQDKLNKIQTKFKEKIKNHNSLLIMAASTHPQEEDIILEIYSQLLKQNKNLNLLIAPRHINRVLAIEKLVTASGFTPMLLSKLNGQRITNSTITILDTIGELIYFYSLADICFVGGSLIPHGGQNILEPIYFSKPTLFGPYMSNFPDIEEVVLASKAGIKAVSSQDLSEKISQLINQPDLRTQLAQNCSQVFTQKQEQANKNIDLVINLLNKIHG